MEFRWHIAFPSSRALVAGMLLTGVAPGAGAAAFSELVTVVPSKNLSCRLAGAEFDICPEFKAFPSEFVRYDAPTSAILRLPEIAPFQRSVTKTLPKALWLQQLTGPGEGRFLSTTKGNYVTAYTCRPDNCGHAQYIFVMETAYRKKWALHARPPEPGSKSGQDRLRWFGDPDENVKVILLATRALYRGEKPVPLR
jgi:hypothetical protein